jgi:hypothetical protein
MYLKTILGKGPFGFPTKKITFKIDINVNEIQRISKKKSAKSLFNLKFYNNIFWRFFVRYTKKKSKVLPLIN